MSDDGVGSGYIEAGPDDVRQNCEGAPFNMNPFDYDELRMIVEVMTVNDDLAILKLFGWWTTRYFEVPRVAAPLPEPPVWDCLIHGAFRRGTNYCPPFTQVEVE